MLGGFRMSEAALVLLMSKVSESRVLLLPLLLLVLLLLSAAALALTR